MSEYSNCWRLEAPNKILQITLSSSSCLSYETASLFFWYKMMIRGVLINPKKKCFITNDSVICLYNIVIVKNYILFITYLFITYNMIMSLMIFYQNYLKYLQHKLLFKNIKQLRTHILPHFKISWYFKYHF